MITSKKRAELGEKSEVKEYFGGAEEFLFTFNLFICKENMFFSWRELACGMGGVESEMGRHREIDEAKSALGAILLKFILYIENIHTR